MPDDRRLEPLEAGVRRFSVLTAPLAIRAIHGSRLADTADLIERTLTQVHQDSQPSIVAGPVGQLRGLDRRITTAQRRLLVIGIDGAALLIAFAKVPAAHLKAVHGGGLMLIARDRDGKPLTEAVVPTDAITPPTEAQRPHDPLEVETVTDGGDLSRLLAIDGRTQVSGAVRARLTYPDGSHAETVINGGSFRFDVPPRERGSMARRPGKVDVVDRAGQVLATRPVAAVSFWHARGR